MNKINLSGVFQWVTEQWDLLLNPDAEPLLNPPSSRSLEDWLNNPLYNEGEDDSPDQMPAYYVDGIFSILMMSPTFQAMYQSYPDLAGIPIYYLKLDDAGGHYFKGEIAVNCEPATKSYFNNHFQYECVSTLAHEYRHGWQEEYLGYPELKYDYSSLIHSFFKEADAVAFQAAVCWELKELGMHGPWGNFERTYPHCAEVMINSIRKDETSFADGRAQNAVLQAWFEDPHNLDYYARKRIDFLQGLIDKPVEDVARNIVKYREEQEAKKNENVSKSRALTLFNATLPHSNEGEAMSFINEEGELVSRNTYLQEDMFDQRIEFYALNVRGPLMKELETLEREADFHMSLANIMIKRGEVPEKRDWDIEIKFKQSHEPQFP